jgi:EAL domain-containing protein (putative c-di-GMP-specific phosphodiesterase class I)
MATVARTEHPESGSLQRPMASCSATTDSRMVAAIIGLAQEFGLTTVAEGVETCEQLTELRMLGCDLGAVG